MKISVLTLVLFLVISYNSFGSPGEIWFAIKDYENTNYYVRALRISSSDPLFGINFMEVGTNEFDDVTAYNYLGHGLPDGYNIGRGFDLLIWDYQPSPTTYPYIGVGKLEFLIYRVNSDRSEQLAFRFKLNLLHSYGTDFTFKYDSYTGIMLLSGQGFEEMEVPYNADLKQWEIRNQTQDLSSFVNDVELTNFLATGPEPNIKTIFTTAVMGFPFPDDFQTGEEYPPGTVAPLWRGVSYGVTVSHTTYTKNNVVYNFRNWQDPINFSSSATFQIEDQTFRFRSMFQPTHPLMVSGYFEGGSGINYQLTWQNPPHTQQWQFGNVFHAFHYEIPREDRYTVIAPTPIQTLGTTWHFR